MALPLIIYKAVSETEIPPSLVINRVAADAADVSHVNLWWAYEDEEMDPLFLGIAEVDSVYPASFPGNTRPIRFWQSPLTGEGAEASPNFSEMDSALFTPSPTPEVTTETAVASETLTRGMLIDLYDDAGTLKARKADATDNTRFAEAFVDADAAISDEVDVYFAGGIVRGLSGLTQGAPLFLSETAGGVTHTPITSGTGKISQQVGVALSPTSFVFDPQEPVELAA